MNRVLDRRVWLGAAAFTAGATVLAARLAVLAVLGLLLRRGPFAYLHHSQRAQRAQHRGRR